MRNPNSEILAINNKFGAGVSTLETSLPFAEGFSKSTLFVANITFPGLEFKFAASFRAVR
jgi:hypothetical protein